MKHDSDRDLYLITIFTFITVLLWIFFELVKTTKTSTTSTVVNQLIAPLTPKLDTDTLNILTKKQRY
jgi:hypothetical protein